MASNTTLFTPRDQEILITLSRTPLTAQQLLTISQTFKEPFRNERYLRRRLQDLDEAGWIATYQYATVSREALNYYKLTKSGYELLNGKGAQLPSRHFFRQVSLGLQEHTRALADFIVHTTVAAHRSAITITDFYRENDLRLTLGDEALVPDYAFQLKTETNKAFNFIVELDNGTEPIFSKKERESWERKISFYDRYQNGCNSRFRVLIVTTKSTERPQHILDAAASLTSNVQRRLFYATSLPEYLASPNPVREPSFLDHSGHMQALLPTRRPAAAVRIVPIQLAPALQV